MDPGQLPRITLERDFALRLRSDVGRFALVPGLVAGLINRRHRVGRSLLIRHSRLGSVRGSAALALAIFVPKSCDIGAYFTGRLFGKHPMAPVLSPKKTWEGAAGGLVTA